MTEDLNDWLSYSIAPSELKTLARPAMYGNGQVYLLAELKRPSVSEAICFGYGELGLTYKDEEHLFPAVYDADTGRKYLLYSTESSDAADARVTFRPDRQIWHYPFDDLLVEVSLFLSRLTPGYLCKIELAPKEGNTTAAWDIYHEIRRTRGGVLFATDADYDLSGGMAWFRGQQKNWECVASTMDAEDIRLGADGAYATDIMIKSVARRANGNRFTAYFARAFGDTMESVQGTLTRLLANPGQLERETADWWNRYLNEVPRLSAPDESFARNFLWSWPNFRVSRIDVSNGVSPAGLYYNNWCAAGLREVLVLSHTEQTQGEAIQLLNDPAPTRDYILFQLYAAHQQRGLLTSDVRVDGTCKIGKAFHRPHFDYQLLGWFCGLIYKYVLTTGDLAVLDEKYDGETTVLQRLEEALEAQLAYRDEETGLFYVEGEVEGDGWTEKLGPVLEAQSRFREGGRGFYCDCNGAMWGTLVAFAELEDLAGNEEKGRTCRDMAEELRTRVRDELWNPDVQFFGDKRMDGLFTGYRGLGGFIAGIMSNHVFRPGGVANREQARKLAEWCAHPDFACDYGVVGVATSSPYFDPADFKGHNQGLGIYRQIAPGLYSHGCYDEAHRQMFKLFRRFGENGGLGPRYRGEMYNTDSGEILPWRYHNFTGCLAGLASVIEGVFGFRWTKEALTVEVHSPWPWAKLTNLRFRGSVLDLEFTPGGTLIARINGTEVARSANGTAKLPWSSF